MRREIHPCSKPTIEDRQSDYQWRCPECGADWKWYGAWGTEETYVERYGFLLLRTRTRTRDPLGGFWSCWQRPERWVKA